MPGEEWYWRKRTLQRRLEQWWALDGPVLEVMFLQEHRAGVLWRPPALALRHCGEV
jgi:hypothetical protein